MIQYIEKLSKFVLSLCKLSPQVSKFVQRSCPVLLNIRLEGYSNVNPSNWAGGCVLFETLTYSRNFDNFHSRSKESLYYSFWLAILVGKMFTIQIILSRNVTRLSGKRKYLQDYRSSDVWITKETKNYTINMMSYSSECFPVAFHFD